MLLEDHQVLSQPHRLRGYLWQRLFYQSDYPIVSCLLQLQEFDDILQLRTKFSGVCIGITRLQNPVGKTLKLLIILMGDIKALTNR